MHTNEQQQLTTPAGVDTRSPDRQQAPSRLENIAGIVLAGAHAWGNCEFEQVFWRPLLPILSKPLVWHILDWLQRGGVHGAQICANGNSRTLRHTLGAEGPMRIPLGYYEDVMPRGPAGCARDAASTMEADTFVVLEGAILPGLDLGEVLEAHRSSNAVVTVVASKCVEDNGCSNGALEPVGIYVMDRSALESVSDLGYQDIKEGLIPRLCDQGQHIAKYVVAGESFARVRCAATYLAANMWALQRFLSNGCLPKGYAKLDGACVHESARVDRSVRIVGPVLIDAGTIIESGAIIVGPTTIGERCMIGRDTVISCSVIWDDCGVGTAAVLEHCIVADHSGVDPGAVLRDSICMWPHSLEQSIPADDTRPRSPGARMKSETIEAAEQNGETWKLEPVRENGRPCSAAYVKGDEQC